MSAESIRSRGFRSDSSVHRAADLVVDYPVISARFLADNLGVSTVSAQKLVKQLDSVGIVRADAGKYRKSGHSRLISSLRSERFR
jgi:hypothetical protein